MALPSQIYTFCCSNDIGELRGYKGLGMPPRPMAAPQSKPYLVVSAQIM